MYGQIHVIVRSLVTRKFGEDVWKAILKESKVDDIDHFLVFNYYTDEMTVGLVAATATVLNLPVTAVLEVFGEYFLIYCIENGYDKMLKTLGDDFRTFIMNLDGLHSLLEMTYADIEAPSFRCDPIEDDGSMNLHYYSARGQLMHPVVTGLLRVVGRELFNVEVTSEVIESSTVKMGDGDQYHVVFHVMGALPEDKVRYLQDIKVNPPKVVETFAKDELMSPRDFCEVFPFHFLFDMKLQIMQVGVHFQKMDQQKSFVGRSLKDVIKLNHPHMELSIENIMEFIVANYTVELLPFKQGAPKNKFIRRFNKLVLKGQMIYMENEQAILFLGSPRLGSIDEMKESNMYLSDIPIFDVTRELILLNQQRLAEVEVSKKLDEATAEMKRLGNALEDEKVKTDTLLYQMLPRKVADTLRDGGTVPSERFVSVTIFFSDIVSFTTISAGVQPMQIVSMLNSLYSKLDKLTNQWEVFKVETIGDAYMVVGGVPEVTTDHAEKVANFAIDMIHASDTINNPLYKNKSIQVRTGLHTGSVCAGVVGDRMPRYCLFGDSVTVANKMESHGIAGRVHVSPTTYELLENKPGFIFEDRGENEIKGTGIMHTRFLLATPERILNTEKKKKHPLLKGVKVADQEEKKSRSCQIL